MKRIRVFTEQMYKEIKKYQEIGLTQRQVKDLTGKSQRTISLVYNTKNYLEYRTWIENRTERLKLEKLSKNLPMSQPIVPTIEVKEEPQDLIKILNNIDERLDQIQETLEAKLAHNKVSWWKN